MPGRKLEMVVADETEKPEAGITAIKKLTAEEKVDAMIGGYTSGVTLAQLPHIARAKTIYLGVGAASPAITQRVKKDYDEYKYIFRVGPIHAGHQARQVSGFITDFVVGELGRKKVAIGRALMGKPSLLLLDEPSVGSAHKLKMEIFEGIRKIRQTDTAILMAEQDAQSAMRIADRVYVLEHGHECRAVQG